MLPQDKKIWFPFGCLFLGLALSIVGIIFLAQVFKINRLSSPVEPSPVVKLTGNYGDYSLQDGEDGAIFIFIRTRNPRAFIKALSDAIEMAEKKSGKKVVGIIPSTLPAAVIYLEKPSPPK